MAAENVNSIVGTESDDTIEGTDQKDEIRSLGGNDVISAHGGDDYIDAGTGDNVVYAAAGNDEIHSGGGNDIIWGDSWKPVNEKDPLVRTEFIFDSDESDLGAKESTDNVQLSINDLDTKINGVGLNDITVIGGSEGDAVKSWVKNGNTAQLNAQVVDVSGKGYGVSNKNGNNGNQTSAIEGNESILFDLGINRSKSSVIV